MTEIPPMPTPADFAIDENTWSDFARNEVTAIEKIKLYREAVEAWKSVVSALGPK
jgi:hypothetical protein